MKQKLRIYDTAQKELLNYKNQFEKPQNSNGYSINLMLQKGRFGLITGLGYSTSGFKTNYITDTNHRHFIETTITRYRMIRDSVKYQGGYYSQIQEYQVSVYTPSALLKGETRKVNFNWIQIPLKVSYQYSLNRLRFSSRVGADFMWLYNLNGTFINQNLTAINTEEKLKKFNVNFSGQLLAGYQLNHNIQAGGSIYMNHQLGSNFVDYKSSFQSKGYGIYVRWGF